MITARGWSRPSTPKPGREKTEVRAVDGVDLDVAEGEVVGFLGPNGAGKTTTLRMLTTLLRPTAGTATVAGYDVRPRGRARAPQHRLRLAVPVRTGSVTRAGDEVVDHGMLYGMSAADARARGQQLFEQLDLEGLWTRQPKAMSGRPAAPARHRHGPDPRADPGLPRRADHRARPAGPRQPLAAHRRPARAARRHRLPHHPLPRRGRRAERPDRRSSTTAGSSPPTPPTTSRRRRRRPRRARGRRRRRRSAAAAEKLATLVAERRCRGRRPPRPRPGRSRAGRAVPGLLRDLDRTGVELDLDRGAPAHPRRRLPRPHRPLAAATAEPAPTPERSRLMTFLRESYHRLPPPDPDEPAQPRLGAHRR